MTMKLRNRLIALVCLILFLGIGAALFLTTTARKPFAVILFVNDGMTPSIMTAARIFSGGGDAKLRMESLPNAALCRNAANDYSIPESASSSTAIAGGKRVNRGSLCIDPSGAKIASLLEIAAARGRGTGLITTGEICGTTSAAYYAKSLNAGNRDDLIAQFCAHAPFDFVAGGGTRDFQPQAKEGDQPTENALLKQIAAKGTLLLHSQAELENQPFWKKVPLLSLLASGPLAETDSVPSLSDLVRIAISNLQGDKDGYLLVVDDPMTAVAASSNDGETMLKRMLAFDQAVETARRYAGESALIVVTGRESVGGLQLNGYPFLRDKGVAILALNAQGCPSLCWSTGPGFALETQSDSARNKKGTPPAVGILSQPTAYSLPQAVGVAGDVLALGSGHGSEKLKGFLDLTDVHRVILGEL